MEVRLFGSRRRIGYFGPDTRMMYEAAIKKLKKSGVNKFDISDVSVYHEGRLLKGFFYIIGTDDPSEDRLLFDTAAKVRKTLLFKIIYALGINKRYKY